VQPPPVISRSFPLLTVLLAIPLIAAIAYISYDRYLKDDGDGWLTYRNERFKYEFRHPPDWKVAGGREPQPGDDFVTQNVLFSPAKRVNQSLWPSPNVAAYINFQGDLCGAGGHRGTPIEVTGVRGTETTCYWNSEAPGIDCNPKPQCVELPMTITRRFEKDGMMYYIFANNHLADMNFNGTPLPADPNAAETTTILRKILDSYRFID
jgi:hypothetical protein